MNWAFRYMAEESLATAEQLESVEEIMTLPIDDAEVLTDDELNEDA